MFNQQRFLNVWALAANSLISVNKISDGVRKKCSKKWRNFDVGEQPITIKLCVFVMEMPTNTMEMIQTTT